MSAAATINALRKAPEPVCLFEDDGTSLVKVWNKRQEILASIEARGPFGSCEYHSPGASQAWDTLTEAFAKLAAESLTGLLAKLWVALAYCDNSGIRCAVDAAAVDGAIRRGDEAELIDEVAEWDFGPKIIWSAIQDIHNLLRLQRGGSMKEAM